MCKINRAEIIVRRTYSGGSMKLLVIIFILVLVGCRSVSHNPKYLPPKATDIVILGNGWSEFTLDGRRYLFCHRFYGYKAHAAIVEITRAPKED